VLINNVGDMASGQASWTEVTEEAIDHVLAVDIKGTMLMVHEFGQRMVAAGGGAIVNVGSTVIVRGSPRAPQYAAGKYGLLGITKSYAKALAPTVRVNTFAPGFMETEAVLARPEWKTGRRQQILGATPAGKIPGPEDMTGAALFLASDDAHHVTGSPA
jgi:3-oxoacyl-[acyl-carrier protein] reductase